MMMVLYLCVCAHVCALVSTCEKIREQWATHNRPSRVKPLATHLITGTRVLCEALRPHHPWCPPVKRDKNFQGEVNMSKSAGLPACLVDVAVLVYDVAWTFPYDGFLLPLPSPLFVLFGPLRPLRSASSSSCSSLPFSNLKILYRALARTKTCISITFSQRHFSNQRTNTLHVLPLNAFSKTNRFYTPAFTQALFLLKPCFCTSAAFYTSLLALQSLWALGAPSTLNLVAGGTRRRRLNKTWCVCPQKGTASWVIMASWPTFNSPENRWPIQSRLKAAKHHHILSRIFWISFWFHHPILFGN